MKVSLALAAVLFACVGFAPITTLTSTKVTGDYVEARTASVFAGACHYNGELVTTGNDALLAWNFSGGIWKGADLSNVKAMAAVTSDHNLGDAKGDRKAELVVDASTDAQVAAVKDLLQTECGKQLGSIVAIRRAAVSFTHTEDGAYKVNAEGLGSLAVEPMPNNECCKQPSLVWYSPLSPLEGRKVGYTVLASHAAGHVGEAWQRSDENSAFYGKFAF